MSVQGRCLVSGVATGNLLFSDTALSFWGGVDLATGQVVDHHHPLQGQFLKNAVLAIPSGRGSCSGSAALLELLHAECAPAALILRSADPILALGALVAKWLLSKSCPIVVLDTDSFTALKDVKYASVRGGVVSTALDETDRVEAPGMHQNGTTVVSLNHRDVHVLAGGYGDAVRVALQFIIQYAEIQGARQLLDVSQAHVDACIYTGPAGLQFAEKLLSLGARFAVPTTLNAISVDQRRMHEIGMQSATSVQASALASVYEAMGVKMSFTCAPYALDTAPQNGDQIGWSESNAVIFANSVLGARTQKYPDFLDVCIALTGRAPLTGCHTDEGRKPQIRLDVRNLPAVNDATYSLLGYAAGRLVHNRIPLITGMEHLKPTPADLKAFCAAFGTTSSVPMLHIAGVTPEASGNAGLPIKLPYLTLTRNDVLYCLRLLNTAQDPHIQLVSLGNPHFLLEEFERLAQLCRGRRKSPMVDVIITTNRSIQEEAFKSGLLTELEEFGMVIITDTCWCMLGEPVIDPGVKNIITNSAKYAHYAPGMVKRGIHFGSLSQCVEAACSGQVNDQVSQIWRQCFVPQSGTGRDAVSGLVCR